MRGSGKLVPQGERGEESVIYRHTSPRELVTYVSTDRAPVLSSGERDR